jgi:hypothetical protein
MGSALFRCNGALLCSPPRPAVADGKAARSREAPKRNTMPSVEKENQAHAGELPRPMMLEETWIKEATPLRVFAGPAAG